MAFTAINKVPGVYIDEIQIPGPIAGVGTSTVAIIGPARQGPSNVPTLVTNPTQFTARFGGYITAPMVYASHAVQGFFGNGGTSCYFVRVSTAANAALNLQDRSGGAGRTTAVVTAKQEGVAGNAITVDVQNHQIADTTGLKAEATLAGAGATNGTAEVNDASDFRAGDIVFIEGGGNDERATIKSINNTTNVITLVSNLTNTYAAGGSLRVADLITGQLTFRVADSSGIESGSYLSITQGGNTENRVVKSVEGSNHFITLDQGLVAAADYSMDAADADVVVQSLEFSLLVNHPSAGTETVVELAMDPRHSRYFGSVASFTHVDVTPADPPNVTPPTNNLPAVVGPLPLANGADDDISAITSTLYTNAIDALERIDEVNILCIPDRTDQTVQAAMIAHCEKMQDRFAVLDPQRNANPSNGIRTQRNVLTSDRGYGALYYPWIRISNPDPGVEGSVLVPPSGHIAGVFARTDNDKGVHKAPANESFTGVLGLERTLTDTEAGQLNELSINVLRFLRGRGHRIWGARTLATGTQWRYVNVRRLLLFIEESIQEGTEFAVFEPNNLALWETVKRQVSDFLTRVWRDGALFGATPDAAFRVRVDDELNPPSLRALGQLHIEVVLYPTTPAEFIVFRIIQQPGGPTIEE